MGFISAVAVGLVVTVLATLLLWLFLPRGVVLIGICLLKAGPNGVMWLVKNESSLSVRIRKVTLAGLVPYVVTDKGEEYRESAGGQTPLERGRIMKPGQGIRVNLAPEFTMVIKYRRAGWAGVLERRTLRIGNETDQDDRRPRRYGRRRDQPPPVELD